MSPCTHVRLRDFRVVSASVLYQPSRMVSLSTARRRTVLNGTARFCVKNRHLSGVMVSVFAIGPKVCGFKPGRGDGFLRAIKMHITPSFGGEEKPSAPSRKILRHVKNHFDVLRLN
jgi:hypothetical protein